MQLLNRNCHGRIYHCNFGHKPPDVACVCKKIIAIGCLAGPKLDTHPDPKKPKAFSKN
jgi:hypothetical protein